MPMTHHQSSARQAQLLSDVTLLWCDECEEHEEHDRNITQLARRRNTTSEVQRNCHRQTIDTRGDAADAQGQIADGAAAAL